MKKTFTQEQIAATLRSVDGGTSVADACRKVDITKQTLNNSTSSQARN